MKIFLDCLPCILRQVFEASCMATNDQVIQEGIMDEAIETLSNYRNYNYAPIICEAMHTIVKKHAGVADPYAETKARDIAEALRLEPFIKRFITEKDAPLLNALKVSATGNIMDSALYNNLDIEACLMAELKKTFAISDLGAFQKDLVHAKTVLIIGDNAGEVVFDKFLAAHLSIEHKVIYAVRETAIINDATLDDALKTGINHHATIISTGCGFPGAVIDFCSTQFQEIFNDVDVVISKGQGNYEALSDTPRKIYFLLKAKCRRIAQALDVNVNDYVFKCSVEV